MTRQDYEDGRDDFFSSTDKVTASPVMTGKDIAGWSVSRGDNVLPSARNGVRVFKTLGAIATLCQDNEIGSFEVVVLQLALDGGEQI